MLDSGRGLTLEPRRSDASAEQPATVGADLDPAPSGSTSWLRAFTPTCSISILGGRGTLILTEELWRLPDGEGQAVAVLHAELGSPSGGTARQPGDTAPMIANVAP